MEMSALGGLDLKLSAPSLQNGMKRAVVMLPATRSGRSEKNTVAGLTPCKVTLLVALSKLRLFALCTNSNSSSWVPCASADLSEASEDAASADAAMKLRRVVMRTSRCEG